MKNLLWPIIVPLLLVAALYFRARPYSAETGECFTGAFLADNCTKDDILRFKNDFGKKPLIIMAFLDWGRLPRELNIADIYSQGCVLCVTWEPWQMPGQKPIDYQGIINGSFDNYIISFARQLSEIKAPVILRFAHEVNGNWYPWSGVIIGKEQYISMYRRTKEIFDSQGAKNVLWAFTINCEDAPGDNNHFADYYPGNDYVDCIAIDGYNWGNTKSWSGWMSFKQIFSQAYNELIVKFDKPIIIGEFGTTSSGGGKKEWIREAMYAIKDMKRIKAFILFNVNKETDWAFRPNTPAGAEFRQLLKENYFKDSDFKL